MERAAWDEKMDNLEHKTTASTNFTQGMTKLHTANSSDAHELKCGAFAFVLVTSDDQHVNLPADYLAIQLGRFGYETDPMERHIMALGVERSETSGMQRTCKNTTTEFSMTVCETCARDSLGHS